MDVTIEKKGKSSDGKYWLMITTEVNGFEKRAFLKSKTESEKEVGETLEFSTNEFKQIPWSF